MPKGSQSGVDSEREEILRRQEGQRGKWNKQFDMEIESESTVDQISQRRHHRVRVRQEEGAKEDYRERS